MPAKRASLLAESRRVFGQGAGRRKTPFRVGLYARVSTHDQQTLPMQNRALREYAARRSWTVVMQVITQVCAFLFAFPRDFEC